MAFGTYTEISSGADEVRELINSCRGRKDRARAEISAVVSEMAVIAGKYGPMVSAIDAMQAADPTNTSKANLKSHIAEILANFNTLQTEVADLDALMNPEP